MQFLKTLFWVVIAVFLAILASRNWHSVTLNLWGDIQADIKVPVLLALMFAIGFIPAWIVLRARMWQLQRRLESVERRQVQREPEPAEDDDEEEPAA